MAEAVGGDVVEADFDHELGAERLPFSAALGAPAAGAAGGVAGEAWGTAAGFELLLTCGAPRAGVGGGYVDLAVLSRIGIEPDPPVRNAAEVPL